MNGADIVEQIVNRKERKTMYRIWVQVKARKRAMDQGDADEKVS